MARLGTLPDWISIDPDAHEPFYRQISRRFETAIREGRLSCGDYLPSSRDLAKHLCVARTTVVNAYDLLVAAGLTEAIPGSGTRVAALPRGARTSPPAEAIASDVPEDVSGWSAPHPIQPEGKPLAFAPGIPGPDQFPRLIWSRLLRRQSLLVEGNMLTGAGQGGFAPLRRMIARHLLMSRGVRCEPSEVIIMSSMTAAISLAASILAKPGDPVAIEDPGHAGTRKAIEHLALTPVHIAVDAEGLRVEDLRLCTAAPRIVCVASCHHWPTGVSLDAARRKALMDWAEHEGAWILETDYDSEFHFGEGPPAPLKAEASGGRVLLTGSFSRTLAPAIRCAYLVMPGELATLFRERAIIAVGEPSLHVQAALAEFMRRGHFVRHVQRQRKVYKDRRDALRQTLTEALGSVMTLRPPAGGLHLVADLDPCYAAEAVSREAARRGLTIQAMAAYYATRPPPNGLHLGFAAVPSKDIPAAVSRLGEAISAAR